MTEFIFRVYNDDAEDVLSRVQKALIEDYPFKALDLCCQYFAAKNAQVHVDAAIESFKQHLEPIKRSEI